MSDSRATPVAGGVGAGTGSRLARMARHQVGRFASVGIVNTLVDLGVFMLLSALGVGVLVANTVSTGLGMVVSFAGNRRFVFGRTGRPLREMTLFVLVCAIGIWVIQPVVILATAGALTDAGLRAPVLAVGLAKCCGILVAAVWNFLLYKHLVFRAPAPGRPAGTAPVPDHPETKDPM